MPVDLYKWEEGGGLVHHCPKCFKPLTTPQARTRCLGEHVEWCKRYHTQLFKKGTSSRCAPCRSSDEQHQRRHREIAELVQKLNLLNPTTAPVAPCTLLTPKTIGALQYSTDDKRHTTKKDRKAAKKAKKVSDLPKVVNAATIEHVGKILHPNDFDAEDGELELKLLNDSQIKDNRFFHKGTSNKREIRNEFVKKERKSEKVVRCVEAEEMESLLQLFNVSPITANSLPEERKIIEQLQQKLDADLLQAQEEMDGIIMRKSGFWRWASKKAYDRLVANGNDWENKSDDSMAGKTDGSGGSTEGDATFSTHTEDGTDDTDLTEPDTDGMTTTEDEVADSISALNLKTTESIKTPKKSKSVVVNGDGDAWVSVGGSKGCKGKKKIEKKPAPKMTIKLTANNGLAKMVQSTTPRTPGFLRYHSQDG